MKKNYIFTLLLFLITSLTFSQTVSSKSNTCQNCIDLVINEVDADQTGTDTEEFIELLWTPNTSLDGYVVVLFNGSGDSSYDSFDLDGKTTDANGLFVLATTAIATGDDIDLGADNKIQNGADAVAVYFADKSDFPNGTTPTTVNLIDALVYGTDDGDDSGLLSGLGETIQYNENENQNKDTQSIQRKDDGTYEVKDPTRKTLSIKENNIEGFATYPNPITNKEFTISSASTSKKFVNVFNLLGKKVLSTSFSGAKSTVDVSGINSGVYFLKVTEEGKTATKKLVIR